LTEQVSTEKADTAESLHFEGFSTCVLLGIAYSASIGGLGTLIGTPPNALLAGFLGKHDMPISFGAWMLLAMPLVIVLLIACWLLLTKVFYRMGDGEIAGGRELLRRELEALGPISRAEWTVLIIFTATAAMWILRQPVTHWPWLVERFPRVTEVNDAMIAMFGAITLFAVPVNLRKGEFALDWETAKGVPWGILLLFGGGLSLAKAAGASGFTEWVGRSVEGLSAMPTTALILILALIVIFLTEVTSNTATAAAFLPIVYGVAMGLGTNPFMLLIPAVLASSCAFMLPVATPPNAIVFGSGRLPASQMARVGFWLNVLVVALTVPFMAFWVAWVLGVEL
jgi:sodium-dependent dicarboxylate transporter 2/3/5